MGKSAKINDRKKEVLEFNVKNFDAYFNKVTEKLYLLKLNIENSKFDVMNLDGDDIEYQIMKILVRSYLNGDITSIEGDDVDIKAIDVDIAMKRKRVRI